MKVHNLLSKQKVPMKLIDMDKIWDQRYDEINAFEEQLVDSGAVVVKFWMAITMDEQLRRFNERKASDFGRFAKVVSSIIGKRLTYKDLTDHALSPAN